jgi:hypothetical protein
MPCPTNLCAAGGAPLKRPYSRFRYGLTTGRLACGRLLPFWIPQTVRLWNGLSWNTGLEKHKYRDEEAEGRKWKKAMGGMETSEERRRKDNHEVKTLEDRDRKRQLLAGDVGRYRLARLIRARPIRLMAIKCCS